MKVNIKLLFVFLIITLNMNIIPVASGANDVPSAWAQKEVNTAIELGIVPKNLQLNWQKNITRGDFCTLAVALLHKRGLDFSKMGYQTVQFMDTFSDDVKKLKVLNIVQGKETTKKGVYFKPNDTISRQEAAKMLYAMTNTAAISKAKPVHLIPHVWNDRNQPPRFMKNGMEFSYLAPWARAAADFCYNSGVMSGMSDNCFVPNGTYTVEQSVVTMLRLYQWADNSTSSKSQGTLFRFYDKATSSYQWKNIDGKVILTIPHAEDAFYPDYHFGYLRIPEPNGTFLLYDAKGQVIAKDNPWSGVFNNVTMMSESRAYVLANNQKEAALISLPDGKVIAKDVWVMNADGLPNDKSRIYDYKTVHMESRNPFSDALAGLADQSGDILIKPIYQWIGQFGDGIAVAKLPDENSPVLIDLNGKIIARNCGIEWNQRYFVDSIGKMLILTDPEGQKYSVVNYNGNVLVPDASNFLLTKNDCIVVNISKTSNSGAKQYQFYDMHGNMLANLSDVDYINCYNTCYGRYAISTITGSLLYNQSAQKIPFSLSAQSISCDGGSAMLFMENYKCTVFDDMGKILCTIPDVSSAEFIDSIIRIRRKDIIEYYTPAGLRLA